MSEQANELLTLTMSPNDLVVIYKSMEKSIVSMQTEFSELEKKAITLKLEIDRQTNMLSIMKAKLEG
jgi:hypothetical protein